MKTRFERRTKAITRIVVVAKKKLPEYGGAWVDFCNTCEETIKAIVSYGVTENNLCFFCGDILPLEEANEMIGCPHGNGHEHTQIAHNIIYNSEWEGLLEQQQQLIIDGAWKWSLKKVIITDRRPACKECITRDESLFWIKSSSKE